MNITTIRNYINDRLDTNDTDFPVAKKTRLLNVAQDQVVNAILVQDRLFQYDDDNYPDLPEGTLDLTSGTYIYDIREDSNFANLLYVAKVFVKSSTGNFYELEKSGIEFETLSGSLVSGSPTKYRLSGKRLVFDINPNYTSADGIKIFFPRIPSPILDTDTTREPGLPTTFHHLLALLTCFYLASAKQMTVKNDLYTEIQVEERKLGLHISKMNNDTNFALEAKYIDAR